MTVQEIIDGMIKKTGLKTIEADKTCDQLITGSYHTEVTKIVTSFMATVEVIQKAIDIGANLIITHEPTWFTGRDTTDWLQNDPVYLEKKELIEKHNIAIWRFHDYMHMGKEDGIYRGYELEFDWAKYKIHNPDAFSHFGACYQIPKTTLKELCGYFKDKLNMEIIQIVGNPQMSVERAGVLVGGGSLGLGIEELPMKLMNENQLDLLICGDITEWTISAYVRDAAAMGMNKGMLVLGHERSEEMGMKHLGSWMKDVVKGIDVIFIDAGEPFKYL
ncbi:Nif3-like dinuclear metal center hexameric protein [Anaerocolumna jejuensis]|uniref:Nif3-like dinuclear metal center hexameric protein n=1 Tax=Anaerocolumna jejuensis TaxID=259063 RepID=UPI003F7BC79D